ncbi:MATE family efflux transporter [Sandaracinus amylolyticus]|uniref:MATE family efflux transporter n=1 Tax=Sandaracinus amylolyticus TaxID=927083 RepID=UPI001F369B0B|nr:MATE family efflux transporter [Sandaracinus amylolyticus]UJR78199.1 Multidrug resistance protein NorM [Sandaracinus amylolyticus]
MLELARLSWPIAISMLSFGVMTLVDTLFVGRLGPSALAGVGLAGTATFALLCFPMGLLRGVKVLVSQSVGADRRGELGAHLGAGLALAIVLGIATLVLGQGLAQLLPHLAASTAAGENASAYLAIRVLGAPFVLAFVALREFRYGDGDTRSPMVAALVGNAANIALNWLMVIQLGWGVRGSAWATVLGHGVELAVVIVAQSRDGFPISITRARHALALWRIGVPTGLQFLLEMGSFALLTTIVSLLGEVQMAAHQIALQVIHFSFLPTIALGEAGSVLAGQAVGANEDGLVKRIAHVGLVGAALYTGACTLIFTVLGVPIVACFTDDVALATTALGLLRVAAFFQIADGAVVVARGVLRGAGDVRVPAMLGICTAWVCTPPLAWFLGRELGLGALGGWIGLCTEILVLAVLCWIRVESGAWKPLAVESRARLEREAKDDAPSEPALAA